ncbi:MAG: hypothetical protein EAX96_14875 [Candidatus Lokiarchaeota archaeon]|nr:hypothetical protein [Candidatus Lokiarchaeota archaeon]
MNKSKVFLIVFITWCLILTLFPIPVTGNASYGNVLLISDANPENCRMPKLVEHDNITVMLWMEGDAIKCYLNQSGTENITMIFEHNEMQAYDAVIFQETLIVICSYYNDSSFFIMNRVLNLSSFTWNQESVLFTDVYNTKLFEGVLALLIDNVTSTLHVAFTYYRYLSIKECSCLARWLGPSTLGTVHIVSEGLYERNGLHPDRIMYNNTYYYIISTLKFPHTIANLMSWTETTGNMLLGSDPAESYAYSFIHNNESLYLFKIDASVLEVHVLRNGIFSLIHKTDDLTISPSYLDVAINASYVLIGYSKAFMGLREVYLSIFSINGTFITTRCVSLPLRPYRQGITVVQQELSVSARDAGFVVWVDQTNVFGDFCYDVFGSLGTVESSLEPVSQIISSFNAWWIIPALIAALILYFYLKRKQ